MGAEHADVVIVGGGPAGLSTARAYRACGGEGRVLMLAEEPHPPYRRPPLTKELLRGEIDESELALEPPAWFAENDVDLRLDHAVAAIDPQARTVTLDGGARLAAGAIVLATGSEPAVVALPGVEHDRVRRLRTLEDCRALIALAADAGAATVLGAGFIGCEAAASLAMRGLEVAILCRERLPQLGRLGAEAAERIARWLGELGVEVVGDAEGQAVADGRRVGFGDGQERGGSFVVLATGVSPRSQLAVAAGLPVSGGAVETDAAMRVPGTEGGVLAVGDVAFATNAAAERRVRVEHWGEALAHGRCAGATLAGREELWREVPGFWSQIGRRTVKYGGWGDGHDEARLHEADDGSFTVWYGREGIAVGVLTHGRDEDYERGRELIARGEAVP